MKKVSKKPIIYAFIDSQNLNLAIRDQGWRLDFNRFYIYLKDKYKVCRAYLFIGYIPSNESLYVSLKQAGYTVIFKPALYRKDGTKGNVDAELVLHTMIEFPHYHKAIIVSGDGDFHCLIEYLENKQKLFHVLIPNPKKYSALLRGFRKYFIYINDLKKKLGTKKEREYPSDKTLGVPSHRDKVNLAQWTKKVKRQ